MMKGSLMISGNFYREATLYECGCKNAKTLVLTARYIEREKLEAREAGKACGEPAVDNYIQRGPLDRRELREQGRLRVARHFI